MAYAVPSPKNEGRRPYFVRRLTSGGYVVCEPGGKAVSSATPFRIVADRHCATLQADDDARRRRGPRPCLRCSSEFVSEGVHHRMCKPCRHHTDGWDPYGMAPKNGRAR